MLKLFHLVLIVSCLSACLGIDPQPLKIDPQPRPNETNTTVIPPSTSTSTPVPTTSTTTVKPTTTTTTTTTTPKPDTTTTTTPKPDTTTTTTTTEKPTTPAPNTTTTTTTTTAAPFTTTTEKPTPVPQPTTDTWTVTEKNVTCIIAKMALQANVTYFTISGNNTALVNLPPKNRTTVSGNCGNMSQILVISWDTNNSLSLNFTKNATSKQFMISEMKFTVTPQGPLFPNSNGTPIVAYLHKEEFITPLSMSYKCDRDETLTLTRTPGGNDTMAIVTVRHLQLEAFHTTNSTKFSTVQECWTPTPDIVPIAVGCALAGLIIIILAGYLIGRRRATARGYLSMLIDNENDSVEEEIPMKKLNCFGRQ